MAHVSNIGPKKSAFMIFAPEAARKKDKPGVRIYTVARYAHTADGSIQVSGGHAA